MLHTIWARLLLLLRAIARFMGGRLLRWGGDERRQNEAVEPQDDNDTGDETGEQQQGAETDEGEDEEGRAQERTSRSPAELVTTAVSLLLIGVLVGLILYDGYATGSSVPATVEVSVDVSAVRQEGEQFYVPYEVHNAGDQTIEEVLVTFEVLDGDALVEETETVIALLGEHGSVSGMLVLASDPAGLEIEGTVSTFQAAEE